LAGKVQCRVGLVEEFVGVNSQEIITVIGDVIFDTIEEIILSIHIELSVPQVCWRE